MILSLQTKGVNLEQAGGKGVNLCKLAQAGFPVPDGFILTTQAYKEFLITSNLKSEIRERIKHIQLEEPPSIEDVSGQIRALFAAENIPTHVAEAIDAAYRPFKQSPVAVRSSATAEDLPGLSFAGQHETYLNVVGSEALKAAIMECWGSLWTARAIAYRERNRISHDEAALAVIVQQMVAAQASGVLFSANPVNGSRLETVIEATFGLGEALVAGQVEPDRYIYDRQSKAVLQKSLGAKGITIKAKSAGGTYTQEADQSEVQVLEEGQIAELAEIGAQIEDLYDYPQDIEWAWSDQQFFILQARAITSLYPTPQGMPARPLQVLFSFAAVQGIFEPFTPLGQDAIRLIFAGGASLFGFKVNQETQRVLRIAGERLWGQLTPILQHPLGARLAPRIFPAIEPGAVATLKQMIKDPELKAGKGRFKFDTFRRLVRFALPILKRTAGYMRSPSGKAEQIQQSSLEEIEKLRAASSTLEAGESQLDHSIRLFNQIYKAFPYVIPSMIPGAGAGLMPLALLNRLSKSSTGSTDLALEITRGLPHNVTTQMDLELWEAARQIQADPPTQQYLSESSAKALAIEYQSGELPPTAQQAMASFMSKYGMRGLGEIDIGRPRWNEDPTHIMGVMQSYLRIQDPELAPEAVFKRGARAAEKATLELERAVRGTFAGGLKARLVREAAERVREMAGLRESPKFHIIEMMWIIRQALLESGRQLAADGILERQDDLFYLYLSELEALARHEERDWQELIVERRRRYEQEMNRKQIPRLLFSDGRVFYQGISHEQEPGVKFQGSPVSPGQVEGKVRVVTNPQQAELMPGEILVCQGTDPAWTPLFLAAGGLVMEMGGMMTHGAIVAREYGIPAVVGVDQATTALKTGQKIQVDGSSGEIILLDQ